MEKIKGMWNKWFRKDNLNGHGEMDINELTFGLTVRKLAEHGRAPIFSKNGDDELVIVLPVKKWEFDVTPGVRDEDLFERISSDGYRVLVYNQTETRADNGVDYDVNDDFDTNEHPSADGDINYIVYAGNRVTEHVEKTISDKVM